MDGGSRRPSWLERRELHQLVSGNIRPGTPLTGEEYLSRAVVGRYLVEGFITILDHLPDNVTVGVMSEKSWISGRATRPRRPWKPGSPGSSDLEWVARASCRDDRGRQVLLATGHSRLSPGVEQQHYQDSPAGRERGVRPICVSRVESMGGIPSGASVAMQASG